MDTVGINFEPQNIYTKQQAIMDKAAFKFDNIRVYNVPNSLDEPSKIVFGKNTVHLQFEDNEQIEEYIQYYFEDSAIGNIKRNGSYMRIDTGCVLLEFFTPEKGIKFTFKDGAGFICFDEGIYGSQLQYKIEPRYCFNTCATGHPFHVSVNLIKLSLFPWALTMHGTLYS